MMDSNGHGILNRCEGQLGWGKSTVLVGFLHYHHVVQPPSDASEETKDRADRFGSNFTNDSTQSEIIPSTVNAKMTAVAINP
jgi:hypothetical protein